MATSQDKLIQTYLEDAIAAEKSFETQLNSFAEQSPDPDVRNLFQQHARETRQQYEDLTSRLSALGGEPSSMKSVLAQFFNAAPKSAQMGHTDEEQMVQNLMMAFAVENAEVAMYESLAIAARASGDDTTLSLVRRIQTQERETAEKVWSHIRPCARLAAEALMHAPAR